MTPEATEICVIGGGPAGAAAARRLARLGHDVMLVERHARPPARMVESLPPSIVPLIEFLDLTSHVEPCLRIRSHGAVIRWEEATPRFRAGDDDGSFLVDRSRFDEALLTAAGEAGVRVRRPALVRRPRATTDGWEVELAGEGGCRLIRAAFVVTATGRNSPLARPRRQLSPSTIALTVRWTGRGVDTPVTFVDVGPDFWCWGCRLPGDIVHAAVFLDRAACQPGGRVALETLCRRVEAESPVLGRHVSGASIGRITGRDATAYCASAMAGPRWVRIGDAAVTLDPLSSQGVQSALATAIQGSLVAHTILAAPGNTAAAIEFYEARCRELIERHQRRAAQLYGRQAVHPVTEFWRRRRAAAEAASTASHVTRQDRDATTDIVAVGRYRMADEARLVELPAVTGDIISWQPALVHPALDRPLAYLGEWPVAQVLSEFGHAGTTVADALTRLSDRPARATCERAIQWLIATGVLVPEP